MSRARWAGLGWAGMGYGGVWGLGSSAATRQHNWVPLSTACGQSDENKLSMLLQAHTAFFVAMSAPQTEVKSPQKVQRAPAAAC